MNSWDHLSPGRFAITWPSRCRFVHLPLVRIAYANLVGCRYWAGCHSRNGVVFAINAKLVGLCSLELCGGLGRWRLVSSDLFRRTGKEETGKEENGAQPNGDSMHGMWLQCVC